MNTNNNKQLITMVIIGLLVAALIAAGIYFIPSLLPQDPHISAPLAP